MSRRLRIVVTEVYLLDIEDNIERLDGSFTAADGTDAIILLDEMDSDDQASHYQYREVRVTDDETGEELTVDKTEV